MFRDSLTAAILRQGPRRYAVSMALLLTLVFVASVVSAELRFEGASTAPWWPAAGISVFAALAARGRGLAIAALILVVTAAANLAAGTIWWMAIGFGIANACEAWLVAAIMRYRRRPGHRFRHPDSVRFIIATFAGAAVIGILAGATVAANGGDLLGTAIAVAASHSSAVLLIGVLGLVPRSSFVPTSPLELALQVLVLGVALGIAFGPFQDLPLVFLPFPVLAWAAFRFTAGVALIEFALVSIAVTVGSFLGWGPFTAVAAGDSDLLIGLVQIFTLSLGVSLLPVAVAQDDRTDLYRRLSAREQLLRGAIVSANAGFVIARRDEIGTYRVVEANPNGERMLASWLTQNAETTTIDAAQVGALLASRPEGAPTNIGFPEGVHLDVIASPVAGDAGLVLIQAIDVTEQRKAAQALTDAFDHERETADRMRALAAQKDEFLSSVSHELRTPVTSILGYSEELAEADLPASEKRSVAVIMRNARRLAELVDDLLSSSRRAGLPPAESIAVDLRSAISDCVEELSPIAERAQVTVEVTGDEDLVIAGDTLGLDRILVNLLANAIKFTPPGGRVDITTSAEVDGFAHIEVADTGRGIPPDELEKVFERFYRVTGANTFVPGTGLGLPIVRDLATRMGGRVGLRSDGATGTTAVVELPLHTAAR
jgi:two-component system, OmpR family, phosphate regulon sensor histidine kinase PhoR